MAKHPVPPRSQPRKIDTLAESVTSRAPRPIDPKQAGLFDKPVPQWIKPCLPTLVEKPPAGPNWLHEIKWDGYRISAYVVNGEATIRTRNGYDWTARFPGIAAALPGLKVRSAVIDGEAVILDNNGKSSFAELQAALTRHGAEAAVFYAFDLLFLNGEDLRQRPLEERRAELTAVIPSEPPILISEEYVGEGADLLRVACEHGLEGIVSKRRDRPYRSGKSASWVKTKCVQSGIFFVIGFQPSSSGVGGSLANIKVASFDGAALTYAGAVGTGFSETVAKALRERLDRLATPRCPLPGLKVKGAVWTTPDLQVEIAFRGLTTAGELRHASFKGVIEAAGAGDGQGTPPMRWRLGQQGARTPNLNLKARR